MIAWRAIRLFGAGSWKGECDGLPTVSSVWPNAAERFRTTIPLFSSFPECSTGIYGQPAVILNDEYDVLLELKTARSNRDMDFLCDTAPVQIRTRRCVEGLQDGGCREALAYGSCFYKKL